MKARGRPSILKIKSFQVKKTTLERLNKHRKASGLYWWILFDEFADYLDSKPRTPTKGYGFRRIS